MNNILDRLEPLTKQSEDYIRRPAIAAAAYIRALRASLRDLLIVCTPDKFSEDEWLHVLNAIRAHDGKASLQEGSAEQPPAASEPQPTGER